MYMGVYAHNSSAYMCRPMSLLGVLSYSTFYFETGIRCFMGWYRVPRICLSSSMVLWLHVFTVCWGFELRSFLCLCSKDSTR